MLQTPIYSLLGSGWLVARAEDWDIKWSVIKGAIYCKLTNLAVYFWESNHSSTAELLSHLNWKVTSMLCQRRAFINLQVSISAASLKKGTVRSDASCHLDLLFSSGLLLPFIFAIFHHISYSLFSAVCLLSRRYLNILTYCSQQHDFFSEMVFIEILTDYCFL